MYIMLYYCKQYFIMLLKYDKLIVRFYMSFFSQIDIYHDIKIFKVSLKSMSQVIS